jgi:hypothetical protein
VVYYLFGEIMRNAKGAQFSLVLVSIILILAFPGTATVVADDGTPPPASEEELGPTPTSDAADALEADMDLPPSSDVLGTPEAEQPGTTEDAISLPELQEQLPENTSVVVVIDEQIEPLATQQATNAFVMGDPIWCPAGASPIPGAGGCTSSYLSLLDLIDDIENLIISEPAANGTVWIMDGADASSSDVIFDGTPAGFLTWRNFQLTLQGGWDGGAAGNIVGESSFSVPIYILDWGASVTVNNISINNTGSIGLEIDTSGDVILDTVSALGNAVSGIYVEADGDISAENLNASNNDLNGAELYGAGSVSVSGTNTFDDNDGDGLYVEAGGDINAGNLSASNNGFGGASLIAVDDVVLVGTNVFNSNYYSGLYIDAGSGNIYAKNVTANGNGTGGTYGAGAEFYSLAGGVTLAGINVFNNNHSDGLYIESLGNVAINQTNAAANGGSGIYLDTYGNAAITCGVVAGNSSLAIDAYIPGTLTLYGVDFGGDPDNNIGVDDGHLVLISNDCFTYGGWGGAIDDSDQPEYPALRYVTAMDGDVIDLDCGRLRQESNPQPTDPKSGALSIELLRRDQNYTRFAHIASCMIERC